MSITTDTASIYQLAMSASAFETLRPMLVDPGKAAAGRLQWRSDGWGKEAILHELVVAESLPQGTGFPPASDFAVVVVAPKLPMATDLLAQIAPRRSQILIVLWISSQDFDCWEGFVFHDGQMHRLTGFRVAGPGMLAVDRHNESDAMESKEAVEQDPASTEGPFSRMWPTVGEEVRQQLKRSVVTLVGNSRNGTLTGLLLASYGVGHIRLIDPDVLKVENLDGMLGAPAALVGEKKSKVLASLLLSHRPELVVSCSTKSVLEPAGVDYLENTRSDLLVTCVDDDAARVAVSLAANRMLVPHLDIATSVALGSNGEALKFGDIRLFIPGQGCAVCAPRMTEEEMEEAFYAVSAPKGALRRGRQSLWNQQRIGSSTFMNAIVLGTAIGTWLDFLAGKVLLSYWRRLDWDLERGIECQSHSIGASDTCPCCRQFRIRANPSEPPA